MQKQPGLEIARLVSHAYDKESNISQQKIASLNKIPNYQKRIFLFYCCISYIYCSVWQNFRYFLLRVFAKLKKGWPVTLTYQERSNPKNVLLILSSSLPPHCLLPSKIIPKYYPKIVSQNMVTNTIPILLRKCLAERFYLLALQNLAFLFLPS